MDSETTNIDEMTGEQLRFEITKALGKNPRKVEMWMTDPNSFLKESFPVHGEFSANREWIDEGEWVIDVEGGIDRIPDWPNDIAAAWELVEQMKAAGIEVGYDTNDQTWYASLTPEGPTREWILYKAETAPMAIARAWLTWRRG